MANSLGGFDITWFAQEALIQLENALGFGSRVYRGYENTPQEKGNTITIPVPSEMTVANAPASVTDLSASSATITLDQWKEVKFAVTDKELNGTRESIINEHIRPAAYKLADDIDSKLAALYDDIPWVYDVSATTINNILQPRKILRDNGVPLNDGMVHLGINATEEASFLASTFMHSMDTAGASSAPVLGGGSLGTRFGVEMFATGNIQTHTSGTVVSAGNDVVGAVDNGAGYAAGSTSIVVDGFNLAETIVAGDSFTVAGSSRRYVATATTTLSSGAGTITFAPGLDAAVVDNAVVTFETIGAANFADSYYANMMFHRNAFALATAPLQSQLSSDLARAQGIQVESVFDPGTGVNLRARRWYDADNSRVIMALDVLYGYATLDRDMACLLRGNV